MFDARDRCCRGSLVQMLDEFLDRVATTLCFTLYLYGVSRGMGKNRGTYTAI